MRKQGNFYWIRIIVFLLAGLFVLPCARAEGGNGRETISVLTYNIWGVISARYRNARVAVIPEAIMELDPDIICLIEAFRPRDQKVIREGLEGLGYPIRTWHHHDCGYGTGILVISRLESVDISYQRFKAEGEIYSYERLGCRGLLRIVFSTAEGPLEFFATHSMPRMQLIFTEDMEVIEGDPKELPRLLQMYELSLMMQERRDPQTRSIVAAGDFNVSPEMREYKLLMLLSGLNNSFDDLHPGENPSTYCIKTNEFATIEGSRIDHIMYQNYEGDKGFYLQPIESCVVMTGKYETKRGEMHLSDHYGTLTVFEVADGTEISTAVAPRFSLPVKDKDFYLAGIKDCEVEFSAEDFEAWEGLSVKILEDFDRRLRPPTFAVKAAAKILVAMTDCDDRVVVDLERDEVKALEMYLEKMK